MNLSAESAREHARRHNGQFGEQLKSDPGVVLDDTAGTPHLVRFVTAAGDTLTFDASGLLADLDERDWDGLRDGSYDLVSDAIRAGLLPQAAADGPGFLALSDTDLDFWYVEYRVAIDPAVADDPPEPGTWRHRLYARQFSRMLADQLGGDMVETGGGCTAVEVPQPFGHIMVSDGNAAMPDGGDTLALGAYDADDTPLEGPGGDDVYEWLEDGPYSVNDVADQVRRLAERVARQ